MGEHRCGQCEYFLQHYTLVGKRLVRVFCGHCTHSFVKRKNQDFKACENFLEGTAPEDAFASREYLSKELLKYVLELPLLPEILEFPPEKTGDPF